VQDVPVRLEVLRRHLEHRDEAGIREAAHTLRGMAANVGADRLAELCRALEADLVTSRSLSPVKAYVDAIEREFDRVREILRSRPWRAARTPSPPAPANGA
jgi:HPt (histidine-containing phosphotransfer) domain-containing protein